MKMNKVLIAGALVCTAVLSSGCSKGPKPEAICDELVAGISQTGIVESVSKTTIGKEGCKALVVADLGEAHQVIREVTWSYTVFEDGKYSAKITSDEKSQGTSYPEINTPAEIKTAADYFLKGGLLAAECHPYIESFLDKDVGFNSKELAYCEIPARLHSALTNYERANPLPLGPVKETCLELAPQVIGEVRYEIQTVGAPTKVAVLKSSRPGSCEVVYEQALTDGYNHGREEYRITFNYRTAYGGYNEAQPASSILHLKAMGALVARLNVL